ncbi:hypothetical protein A2U01_0007982, partial [Trifolium medium]|nr:hypothetical protein [Trifolium medium]
LPLPFISACRRFLRPSSTPEIALHLPLRVNPFDLLLFLFVAAPSRRVILNDVFPFSVSSSCNSFFSLIHAEI